VDDIDNLKTNPGVLRLYGSRIKLRRENGKLIGLCPFHSEKSGSFTIFEKDCLFKCFGCGASGNVMQFVQKMDNCDFKAAVVKVRDFLGENNWAQQAQAVDAVFKPAVESSKTYKSFTLAEYSGAERNLAQSEPAKTWLLKERGIALETAQKLHLGFKQNVGRLAGENNADIADKGWVSYPCVEDGKVISIKYRSIVRKAFCKQGGMATALFNTETIDLFEPVYLVEGELDACALEQAGFHAVSLQSASTHPTPEQKDQLMRAGMVILAGDNDGGVGEGIMQKLWRELQERTYLLKWPPGVKDANQFFLETCKWDVSIFQTKIEELTLAAKSQPMADVYSIQEVMQSSQQGNLTEVANRFRFTQPAVDKMAILLPGSVLGIYATNTGMGKTAFTVEETLYNATKYGDVVLNWQAELSPDEIATMIAAQVLRKDRNTLTTEDKKQAAAALDGVKYYVGHNPSLTNHDEVLDLIEAAVKRLGATIVVLDTFHNVTASETNGTAIETMAANRIKNMAMKYKLKWVNVFQPRKSGQQSKGKKTHISDIRGAGAAADCADTVLAIHRDLAKHDDDMPADDIYEAKTLIQAQKTRAKGTGKAETYLMFYGCWASFQQIDQYREEPPTGEIEYGG
jgi:hypothetical protein